MIPTPQRRLTVPMSADSIMLDTLQVCKELDGFSREIVLAVRPKKEGHLWKASAKIVVDGAKSYIDGPERATPLYAAKALWEKLVQIVDGQEETKL